MVTGQMTLRIARPVAQVFDFVADSRNEPAWNGTMASVEQLSPGPVGLGARFRGRSKQMGRLAYAIVEYDRPRRVAFRGTGRGIRYTFTCDFAPDGAGTRGRCRMDLALRGPLRVVEPLLTPLIRSQLRSRGRALQAHLERTATPVAAPHAAR